MLKLINVSKSFRQAEARIDVLNELSLEVKEGEKVAIIGPSGSGKSTLLSLMSGMDKPDKGEIWLDNENLVNMSEEKICKVRNRKTGIIFQAFELIPSFTALENVLLPLDISGKQDINKTKNLLTDLGLGERLNHLPKELSGGEQQRVAIARALINEPEIIFADEPTGNLDNITGNKVVEILFELIKKYNKTLVLITHDHNLAKRMDRIFELKEGKTHEFNSQSYY